jgi:hypothetical protein
MFEQLPRLNDLLLIPPILKSALRMLFTKSKALAEGRESCHEIEL